MEQEIKWDECLVWFLSGKFFNLLKFFSLQLSLFVLFYWGLLCFCLPYEQALGRTCLMQKRKRKKNLIWEPFGLWGCSTCTINGIDWAYFTFGGNIPYSSLCIVFSFYTEDFHIEFILSSFEPCHFCFLGSFSMSCIFLWWDLCLEESEQNFSFNFRLFWSCFWNSRAQGWT